MKRRKGFTLIELLVVISIMSLLMSILLPVLSKAREQGKRIDCLSNLRQLTLAWNMYAMDNDDKLCSPDTSWNDPALSSITNSWVADGPEIPGNTTGGTEQAIKDGVLWSYTKSLGLHECKSARNYHSVNSRPDRLRDYSISGMMGTPTAGGTDLTFRKLSEISRPSEKMVFIDADGGITSELEDYSQRCWLGNFFWVLGTNAGRITWGLDHRKGVAVNMITARHSDGCNLSFADGHCEYWKYKDPRTVKMANRSPIPQYLVIEASSDNLDLRRMYKLLKGKRNWAGELPPP
jgi:prepilin-type N-terminal cleavage/methylation domain-containing protein/prepilin-type processing-associated H-X9-DG protein